MKYLRHFFFAHLLTSPFYHDMKLQKLFLSLIFLLTLVSVVSADEPQTTAVLVHGAFADGSSWSRVIPILEAKGLKVAAVQNPLSSLADDVAATRRAIDQQTGPVVLVGHSWAGVVITEAANDPKVKALVYVAAFAPDNGHLLMIYLKVSRPPNGHPNCRRIRADFCDCRRTGI